jgi:predicted branched-subunit amino acid permease
LCVNLRFVIFSAQLAPLLRRPATRPAHAHVVFRGRPELSCCSCARFPERAEPVAERAATSWGGVALNWIAWQVPSMAGHLLGERIPPEWGLGFAGSLALLGADLFGC